MAKLDGGNPFDNAKAECFMNTLKTAELNARSFKTINDARSRIDDFIANFLQHRTAAFSPWLSFAA